MKKLFKYIGYLVLIILVAFTIIVGTLVYYKDAIILIFVNDANKHLNTKVEVDKINLEIFETFPYFSLDFENIKITETIAGSTKNFAQAGNLYVSLSLWDLLDRKYKIKKLYIKNGAFNFKIFKNGTDNFSIFKTSQDSSAAEELIEFDLSDVKIENVALEYGDQSTKNRYDVLIKNAAASFHFVDDNWDIKLKSNLHSNEITLNNLTFFKNKPAAVKSTIIYSEKTKTYKILPSEVTIMNALFKLEGLCTLSKKASVDIKFSQSNSDLQTIISFLPTKLAQSFSKYKSNGEVYFNGVINGYFNRGYKPLVKIEFGCKNVSFYHPDAKSAITEANFTGSYSNAEDIGRQNSYFKLQNVKALVEKQQLSGNFSLINLDDPLIEFDMKADMNAENIIKIIPSDVVEKATGLLHIDINFKGKSKDIKNKNYRNLITDGKISLDNVNLKLFGNPLGITNCYGTFDFTKSDLVAKTFSCMLGNSDFKFDGNLKNIIPYLLYPKEPLEIVASLQSEYIDLDQLLSINNQTQEKNLTKEYRLRFEPTIEFDLSCKIKKIKFKKFKPSSIVGNISLGKGVLKTDELKMNIAKGAMSIKFDLLAQKDSSFVANATVLVENMEIDSIFYVNDNFGQSFITNKNLKGVLTSTIKTSFDFDKKLQINKKSLIADINMVIKNGQLINFKPLQSLSKFVDEEALQDIKFSELKNNFTIANQKINIPEMVIKSNIITMNVMGSHTFDNQFEYHIKLPLKNYKKKNVVGEAEAISGDIFRGFYLYLIIKGTPDNYKILYDKVAVVQKIKERLEVEKKEFTDLFKKDYIKNKQEKEKVLEMSDEEMDL